MFNFKSYCFQIETIPNSLPKLTILLLAFQFSKLNVTQFTMDSDTKQRVKDCHHCGNWI